MGTQRCAILFFEHMRGIAIFMIFQNREFHMLCVLDLQLHISSADQNIIR